MRWPAIPLAASLAMVMAACGDGSADDASPAAGVDGGGGADARDAALDSTSSQSDANVTCDLGTVYPNADVIDPDAPVYEDANWTQAEVTTAFADAKAQDDSAYRAYRAARELGSLLECPFCACGCAVTINHQSAIDCFKDMHGFA